MTADRDRLIAAMAGLPVEEWDGVREAKRLRIVYGDKAERLMPVVDAIAREKAAAELELAAVLTVPSQDTSEEVRKALFRRADALRAAALSLPAGHHVSE